MAHPMYAPKGIGKGRKQIYEKFLLQTEMKALVDVTHDGTREGRDASDIFVLAGVFGLRLNEILSLTFEDMIMLPSSGQFKVRRLKKRRVVEDLMTLSTREKDILLSIVAARKKLSNNNRLFNVSDRSVQYMFAYYAGLAGILRNKPRASFHALRHTCAMEIWKATQDMEFLRSRLGHSSFNYIKLYVHMEPDHQRELASKRRIAFA